MFEIPKRDPQQEARILNSVFPSEFFPKKGEYFRVRSATIADRSYMGDIWLCVESQDHCTVGKRVLGTYQGLSPGGTLAPLGDVRAFVAGDMIFYDCTKIMEAVEEDRGAPVVQPAQPEGEGVLSDE